MKTIHSSQQVQIKSIVIYLAKILVLAVIYHLAARVGLSMAYVQANTSPVWPPTGIGLAALLIFGYRLWPGISLGVLIGSLLTGAPFSLALGITIGNTLEALVAVYFLKKFVSIHNEIDRIQDVVGLVLVSLVCTTIGASIGNFPKAFIRFRFVSRNDLTSLVYVYEGTTRCFRSSFVPQGRILCRGSNIIWWDAAPVLSPQTPSHFSLDRFPPVL